MGKALDVLHLTQVQMSRIESRTEMTICAISSSRRNSRSAVGICSEKRVVCEAHKALYVVEQKA